MALKFHVQRKYIWPKRKRRNSTLTRRTNPTFTILLKKWLGLWTRRITSWMFADANWFLVDLWWPCIWLNVMLFMASVHYLDQQKKIKLKKRLERQWHLRINRIWTCFLLSFEVFEMNLTSSMRRSTRCMVHVHTPKWIVIYTSSSPKNDSWYCWSRIWPINREVKTNGESASENVHRFFRSSRRNRTSVQESWLLYSDP